MTLLVMFPGSAETSAQHVGGKASSLIRMAAAGHRVPPGAVLTTEFFAPCFAVIQASGAWKAFREAEPARWPERCAALQSLVAALAWNEAQRRALSDLEGLLSRMGNGQRFAVRSSSPDEDTASASFAGLYETRLGVPKRISDACVEARQRLNCGRLDIDHSYVIQAGMLAKLPGVLRIYVGCALQLYGDIEGVDLIKIHMKSGKVSLMIYDDFKKPLPLLKQRIKVRLRDQEVDWFDYGEEYEPQPLYLKSLYLAPDDPLREAQERFDQRVCALKGFDPAELGPSLSGFERIVEENGVDMRALERSYYEMMQLA